MSHPRRIAPVVLAALAIAAMAAVPAHAAKKKEKGLPDVDFAVAVFEEANGTVEIAVNVHDANSVRITFEGATHDAATQAPQTTWWSAIFEGSVRDCYRIVVHASNDRGSADRRIGAGRLATAGCVDCSEAESAAAQAHHKVKRARTLLRRADSADERRDAKRRLRRAERRLDRAEQRLESCLAQRAAADG
jgi:hypothetical protein